MNKLMNRIEKLKINVYEDKLNLKALEIQYLKTQEAPHSLINCLSAIASMRLRKKEGGSQMNSSAHFRIICGTPCRIRQRFL